MRGALIAGDMLLAGQIGVGLRFTTDPGILARHLVILADSRALPSAENITPLASQPIVERYCRRLLVALDAVSARLSTSTLRGLDGRVELARLPPRSVADDWLRAQALIPQGEVGSE